MRISDWSSDVCSSDLRRERGIALRKQAPRRKKRARADDGPGDRVIALLLSNGAAKRPADDPAYHAHVSFPLSIRGSPCGFRLAVRTQHRPGIDDAVEGRGIDAAEVERGFLQREIGSASCRERVSPYV